MLSFKESIKLIEATEEEFDTLTEALTMSQRLAAGRAFKRIKAKVKLGRDRAKNKTASAETIQKRAQKAARKAMFKKLAKDVDKGQMSFAQRQTIEKRLDKLQGKIKMMAKRMVPSIRKLERERKKSHSSDK